MRAGKVVPSFLSVTKPISSCFHCKPSPKRSFARSSTLNVACEISGPMPSPGRTRMSIEEASS